MRPRKAVCLAAMLAVLAILLTQAWAAHARIAPPLVATFLDVGQGDAIWLKAPNGADLLIDGGPQSAGASVVSYLTAHGCTDIEIMALTHPHADHLGGLVTVLESMPVYTVWYNGQSYASSLFTTFQSLLASKGVPTVTLSAGQTLAVGPLTIAVLHPTTIGTDCNNNSLVLRVSYGDVDFLLTGDIEASGESEILANGYTVESEVLKVAHHGSDTSTSWGFLTAVSPAVAVISVGAGNSYGHPSSTTLSRLASVGAATYRTDLDGTVTVTTDGLSYLVSTAQESVTATPTVALTRWAYLPVVARGVISNTPTPTPTPTRTPTRTPTPTPTSTPAANTLRITALQYAGSDEYVEITNYGPNAQVMTNWRIQSVEGDQWYTFPSGYTLATGAYVRVHSGPSAVNNPPTDLKWTGSYIWNNDRDEARLYNALGQLVDNWAY